MTYHQLFAVLIVFCAFRDTLGLALGLDSLGGLGSWIGSGIGGGNIGTGMDDGATCGNVGIMNCCNNVVNKTDDDPLTKVISGTATPNFDDIFSGIAFNCITVAGSGQGGAVAGTSCNQQEACCGSDSQFGGFFNLGCFPLNGAV